MQNRFLRSSLAVLIVLGVGWMQACNRPAKAPTAAQVEAAVLTAQCVALAAKDRGDAGALESDLKACAKLAQAWEAARAAEAGASGQ